MITGLEFSDTTLRFVTLKKKGDTLLPVAYATIPLAEGIIREGKIVDANRFTLFLKTLKKEHRLKNVRITLPIAVLKVGTLGIDSAAGNTSTEKIKVAVEKDTAFNAETTFDTQFIAHTKKGRAVQYIASTTAVLAGYLNCFKKAGLAVVSVEHPFQGLANSLLGKEDSVLMMHVGRYRTNLVLVARGMVIDVLPLEYGYLVLSERAVLEAGVRKEEVESVLREHGFNSSATHQKLFSFLSNEGAVFSRAITEARIEWTKRFAGMFPPVSEVVLSGYGASIAGFADFIHASIALRTTIGNPWRHCFSFDTTIPQIPFLDAQQYAIAIGLACAQGGMNMLPAARRKQSKRVRAWKRAALIVLIFLLGVTAGLLVAYYIEYGSVIPAGNRLVELFQKIIPR